MLLRPSGTDIKKWTLAISAPHARIEVGRYNQAGREDEWRLNVTHEPSARLRTHRRWCAAAGLCVVAIACGKSTSPTTPTPSPTPSGAINHVFVVVEENTSFDAVIGNSSMPYLNSLATQYALATQYYANARTPRSAITSC
jgi:phospholipase C